VPIAFQFSLSLDSVVSSLSLVVSVALCDGNFALCEIRCDQGSCADGRMDECHGERDLVGRPPTISLTQDDHEASSAVFDDSSFSQTKKPAKSTEKQNAKQEKNRKRRRGQKAKQRDPARAKTTGEPLPINHTLRLSGRTMYSMRRNLKKQISIGKMTTQWCPDFDVEDTIRNARKSQPAGNKDAGFEVANEPTLKLVEGDFVTLSDMYVSMIHLIFILLLIAL